ncbi:lysophospholipid acyltransferase family protein [uncultured Polaribacter sp.]|uniref:lysophospholipid acyltransferase family protein n=1 Tax=uncultured Polaribacter sp. TaxID=174711 RepID=UPI00261CF1A3|nr:lysophospholipid acyltransferase family protein [uncultured Polaribacter sp.]
MNKLVFYIVYPIIWLLSKLPMWFLYILSDIFSFLIYHVFGYRKKIVVTNIKYAFLEKSEKEILEITKKFYKNLTDIAVESFKSFSISEKEISERYTYKNPELVNKYIKQGKSVVLVGAHLANWEWSFGLPLVLEGSIFGTYSKLRNKAFEKKLLKTRTKFGCYGIKTTNTVAKMTENFEKKIIATYILLSDQSPRVAKTFYWSEFFGVKVPIHTGAEMLAKKFDLVVINYVTKRVKRGYYEAEFELLTENSNAFKNYDLSEKYLRLTEKNIKKQPENYLWSHKRFKHKDSYDAWLKMKPQIKR